MSGNFEITIEVATESELDSLITAADDLGCEKIPGHARDTGSTPVVANFVVLHSPLAIQILFNNRAVDYLKVTEDPRYKQVRELLDRAA